MAYQNLIAGQRLVDIVMSELHHGLLSGLTVIRAQIEVNRHTLHGSGRGVVERKVIQIAAGFTHPFIPDIVGCAPGFRANLAVGLAGTYRKCVLTIFTVVNIAKIRFDLPRPEEFMGGRKKRQRATIGFENGQAVPRFQRHHLLIEGTSKSIVLPSPRRIPPHHPRVFRNGEALQPGRILVSHGRLIGFCNGFLPEKICAAIERVLQ